MDYTQLLDKYTSVELANLVVSLLKALERARDELLYPNRGPSGSKPTLDVIEQAIESASN